MKNISRRSFLKTGAVAAAGLTIVPGSVLGHGMILPPLFNLIYHH